MNVEKLFSCSSSEARPRFVLDFLEIFESKGDKLNGDMLNRFRGVFNDRGVGGEL